MLSDLELEIVKNHKEWEFGAYLQWAWMEYPNLRMEIAGNEYPEQERLRHLNKRMNGKRLDFDCCYFLSLPLAEANPLQVEQEAWKLLSPKVKQHVNEFGDYIEAYSPKAAKQEQLLAHVDVGWDLLQKWNVIGQSFGAKYDTAVYRGTQYFSGVCDDDWLKGITLEEEVTRRLIRELQAASP